MVDLEQVLQEVVNNDPENMARWVTALTDSERATTTVLKLFGSISGDDPGFMLQVLLLGSGYMTCVKAAMAYSFEAGRLYGRSELVREMGK